jgi:acetyl esterase/lipase
MSWLLLVLGTSGVLYALNALAPRKGPPLVFLWSFFASWLTIELVWHHLVFGAVLTALLVNGGALDDPAGVVGLVLMGITELLLVSIGLVTRRTVVSMRGALADLGPGADAPRFPRSHVLLPFLLNHRKGVTRTKDIEFARLSGKRLKLDVTIPSAPVPAGRTLRPALMQIHGGGWVLGDKREQGIPLLNHMAAQGWVGFNVNYRLSPGVAMPEHLVDLKRGLAWIKEHAADYGVDPDFVCITGGSAGGHLTALMGLTVNEPQYQPGFEEADTGVAAAVPFYGIYDFTDEGTFGRDPEVYRRFLEPIVMQAFLADEPERFRDASPLHHLRADAPPFFVIHGDKDTLAPVEDARTFVERLRDVSEEPVLYAEMQGAQHAFEIFPSVRTARVIEGVERFLSTLWERRSASTPAVEAELADALTD